MGSEDPFYNRRLRGTKVYHMRHRIALSVIAVGGLMGVGMHYLPHFQILSGLLQDKADKESEYVKERRIRFAYALGGTVDTIKDRIKDYEEGPKD